MNLIDINRDFSTEDKCLAYLEQLRWPSGLACLKCGSVKVKKLTIAKKSKKQTKRGESRWIYQCLEQPCRHQFSVTSGTIFHDSHLPLKVWFTAIALICNAKKSLSALQLQRDLGIGSYRTAWYLGHRIRKAMAEMGQDKLTGTIEADETFVGGKFTPRSIRPRHKKQGVMGLAQRGGKVEARMIPDRTADILLGVIKERVSKKARVITDEFASYKPLRHSHPNHQTVNHIDGEYFRLPDVHTNTIENFWSLLKRGIVGQFHKVSIKHLERYLAEFTFRFNQRRNDGICELTLQRLLNQIQLPYKKLTASQASES